ncbi:unnamed protein product [Diplocarpon coronariae]
MARPWPCLFFGLPGGRLLRRAAPRKSCLRPARSVLTAQLSAATDVRFTRGIPEIPGALPVAGHLLALGDDHATTCESWWRKSRASVFQIRLGDTRAVVNSFDDAKRMLIGRQSAVIDRPSLYTLHGIVSSTRGFTIGSSPWDESCKNKRTAAGAALGRPEIRQSFDMFDLESYCIVRDMARDSDHGSAAISIVYLQRSALNTTLTLCYGIRMDSVYEGMLREILHVGSAISQLRSASENYQDYIPIPRYWPNNEKTKRSRELRDRRDKYLDALLDQVREMIRKGTDKPGISAAILKDGEPKLTGVEVSSICLSLVSSCFETIPGTLTSCIGALYTLSTSGVRIFQDKAYADIRRHYPDVRDAWRNSFRERERPVPESDHRRGGEILCRVCHVPPQQDCHRGEVVPQTMMLTTSDLTPRPSIPKRWLASDGTIKAAAERAGTGLQHFAFGAGSRACSGQTIAGRRLDAALLRITCSYRVVASETKPPSTDYVEHNQVKAALVAIPKDFDVRLIPRDGMQGAREDETLDACLGEAMARTPGYYKEESPVKI